MQAEHAKTEWFGYIKILKQVWLLENFHIKASTNKQFGK